MVSNVQVSQKQDKIHLYSVYCNAQFLSALMFEKTHLA